MITGVMERDLLVQAAQTGDPAAISQLLAQCQPDVRRYARRHCHASDVDDAVQESLLTLSRKLGGLKAAIAFTAWLSTVIKRHCMKLARITLRLDPLDEEAIAQQLTSRTDISLRIDLTHALESLPEHYREVILCGTLKH